MTMYPKPALLDATDPSVREVEVPPEEVVVSGRPTAEVWPAPPLDGSRAVSYGIWAGQPGSMQANPYPHDEVFVVLHGLVHLESADGTRLEVRAGDTCFLPSGWRGIWHTIIPTTKTYFIAEQPAAPVNAERSNR